LANNNDYKLNYKPKRGNWY